MQVTKLLEVIRQQGLRVLKVLSMGRNSARTAHLVQPFGEDNHPAGNWQPIYCPTENSGQPIIVGFINPSTLSNVLIGEKRIFSLEESGQDYVESFFIHLKNDGSAIIGGEGDFAVRYNELETAFNQLKDDFNAHIQAYNTHVHSGVIISVSGGSGAPAVGTPGNSGAPTSTDTESAADITPAKIDNIKLPASS